MNEKDILLECLGNLEQAKAELENLEDDEAHADLYWDIDDIIVAMTKRWKAL